MEPIKFFRKRAWHLTCRVPSSLTRWVRKVTFGRCKNLQISGRPHKVRNLPTSICIAAESDSTYLACLPDHERHLKVQSETPCKQLQQSQLKRALYGQSLFLSYLRITMPSLMRLDLFYKQIVLEFPLWLSS